MNLVLIWVAAMLLHNVVLIEIARWWERYSQTEKSARQRLAVLMRKYPHLANTWHDEIAQSFVQQGGSPSAANQAAVRAMRTLLDVDTSAHAKACAAVRIVTGGHSRNGTTGGALGGMLSLLILALLVLPSCVTPGTEVSIDRDPQTGDLLAAHFVRTWSGGPVHIIVDRQADGSLRCEWESDVDLDPAVSAEQIRAQRLDRVTQALENLVPLLASQLAGVAGVVAPVVSAVSEEGN